MLNFVIINVILAVALYGIYYYISNEENKSMFLLDVISSIWLWYIAPIIGAGINIIAGIINKDIKSYYIIVGIAYLSILLARIIVDEIKRRRDVKIYNKSISDIKRGID